MRMSQIPDQALTAKPTRIPTKMVEVYDWDMFYKLIKKEGFVVIDCPDEEIRTTETGADESIPVKSFNSWTQVHHKHYLKTKRLGANRWFIAI